MGRYQKTGKPFLKKKGTEKNSKDAADFISPLDFLNLDAEQQNNDAFAEDASQDAHFSLRGQGLFFVGTDCSVGKTVAMCALGILLKEKQVDAGVMKPIDCGGQDIHVFKDSFDIGAVPLSGSVYSFHEKITPYFAFKKNHTAFDLQKIIDACRRVMGEHAVTLIEGSGGLFDPLTDEYTTADLVKQLGLRVVIVAPLRRGTMNHLMLLAHRARACGITIQGVLLTETEKSRPKAYFLAKVQAVRELARLAVIGIIPFLEKGSAEEVLEKCHKKVSFKLLLNFLSGSDTQSPAQIQKETREDIGHSEQKQDPASVRGRRRGPRRRRSVRKGA